MEFAPALVRTMEHVMINVIGSFICDCMPGYTSETCADHINDYDPNPCSNNESCTDLINDFMCTCITGYTDANCMTNIDNCSPNPCENNGTCNDLVNNFFCTCLPGYTGKNCIIVTSIVVTPILMRIMEFL